MRDFSDKKIILGICGGIAAYKAAFLVRELTQLGAMVRVIMTKSASQFITPLTLQALSGHKVHLDLFDEDVERAMGHIELARWADYLLIAPISADVLAKMAHGLADDLLTTLYLVAEIPVIICPAMNKSMWQHPATQHNKRLLLERSVIIVGPDEGIQACGEQGFGRLCEVDSIIDSLRLQQVNRLLTGKRVLITAGPTREAIDPVRYISNYSSGKMGYALAMAAALAGAEVTLISGPTSIEKPLGVNLHIVDCARNMYIAVMNNLHDGMIFIGCAAVADYYVDCPLQEKFKKTSNTELTLKLQRSADIVTEVAASGKAAFVLGFAAETSDLLVNAKQKLDLKGLDMVVANLVGKGLGFEANHNQVTILTKNETLDLPKMHKTRLAGEIISLIAANMGVNICE